MGEILAPLRSTEKVLLISLGSGFHPQTLGSLQLLCGHWVRKKWGSLCSWTWRFLPTSSSPSSHFYIYLK